MEGAGGGVCSHPTHPLWLQAWIPMHNSRPYLQLALRPKNADYTENITVVKTFTLFTFTGAFNKHCCQVKVMTLHTVRSTPFMLLKLLCYYICVEIKGSFIQRLTGKRKLSHVFFCIAGISFPLLADCSSGGTDVMSA